MAISPDDRRLIMSCRSSNVIVWSLAKRRELRVLKVCITISLSLSTTHIHSISFCKFFVIPYSVHSIALMSFTTQYTKSNFNLTRLFPLCLFRTHIPSFQ